MTDTGWFFDTELLVLAERAGLRIHEVPVDWVDDPDSRVDIVSTALADLRGVARLLKGLASGAIPVAAIVSQFGPRGPASAPRSLLRQSGSFAAIGILSTAVYAALFPALRTDMGAQGANFAALLATAVLNTTANRRFTSGRRGRAGAARQ